MGEVVLHDPTAVESAYRAHHLALLRLAWLMSGSRERAEDAVQEVFLRYQGLPSAPRDPWSYLRRMVVNEVIDAGRRAAVEARFRPDQDLVLHDPELDETWAAVCELSEGPRRALILRYYADLPLAEVAEVMGAPLGTVKSWIHRGLERLREVSI